MRLADVVDAVRPAVGRRLGAVTLEEVVLGPRLVREHVAARGVRAQLRVVAALGLELRAHLREDLGAAVGRDHGRGLAAAVEEKPRFAVEGPTRAHRVVRALGRARVRTADLEAEVAARDLDVRGLLHDVAVQDVDALHERVADGKDGTVLDLELDLSDGSGAH